MRLINTSTLALSEFFGSNIPEYVILSHTWEVNGEVTYQQWIAPHTDALMKKSGYQKIIGACRIARSHEIDWVWVDTNCIDKSSSAELSEAINSMFTWYHGAVECYVYMADVPIQEANNVGNQPTFRESKWFTRGWTLQELLAPKKVIFYSCDWVYLGTRDNSLLQAISEVTGIEVSALSSIDAMSKSSVAAKMSWLSRRQTTREEDTAYCMLGIFDLNMPLLYGEGHKSFTRLQEEIIRTSSDQSIFAWSWNDDVPSDWTSFLAPSPSTFRWAADLVPSKNTFGPMTTIYTITNIGLSIELPLAYSYRNDWILLDVLAEENGLYRVGIPIRRKDDNFLQNFDRSSVPRSPVALSPDVFLQRHDLYLEYRPSRFIDKTGAVQCDPGSGSGCVSLGSHFSSKFGLLLLFHNNGRYYVNQTFTVPKDAMDDSGMLRFGNSNRSQVSGLSSIFIYTANGDCIYVGVRPRASQETGRTDSHIWYLSSWHEKLSPELWQDRLDHMNGVIERTEDPHGEPPGDAHGEGHVLLREGFVIFADVGRAVNLETTEQGRVVCLKEDLKPLKNFQIWGVGKSILGLILDQREQDGMHFTNTPYPDTPSILDGLVPDDP